MTCTYRGHGAVLAAGAAVDASFAEILGREGGLCGGKGGSMHLADLDKGIIGSNAIVGAQLPISVGAGLAAQHKKTGKLSVAFTGDGSTNIGAFHESLNMAAVWRLPVVVVIENNHYGEYSPLAATTAIAPSVGPGRRLRHSRGLRRRQRSACRARGRQPRRSLVPGRAGARP